MAAHGQGLSGNAASTSSWAWSIPTGGKRQKPCSMVSRSSRGAVRSTADTLPSARALYTPLRGAQRGVGVLGVMPADPRRFVDTEQRALLDVFASQIASALERAQRAENG